MNIQKMYRYLGRNGTITSRVLLENISPIEMINLEASKGKILTNGQQKVYSILVFADEVDDWYEVEDNGQK